MVLRGLLRYFRVHSGTKPTIVMSPFSGTVLPCSRITTMKVVILFDIRLDFSY